MPPVAQSGSRGGLITALVIFVLGTFIAGALAVYNYVELDKARRSEAAAKSQIEKFANSEDKIDPAYPGSDRLTGRKTVARALIEQNEELASVIVGHKVPPGEAKKVGEDGMGRGRYWADASGNLKIQADGLARMVEELGKLVKSQKDKADAADKSLADLTQKQGAIDANYAAAIQERDRAVKAAQGDAEKARTDFQQKNDEKDKAIAADQAAREKMIADIKDDAHKLTLQVGERDQLVAKLQRQNKTLIDILQQRRIDPRLSLLRNVDGKISGITSGTTVHIDLGYGDQISPGMTFEVYDRNEGIPKGSAEIALEEQLPAGKASIEVVSVGQNSSECRIIRKEAGINIADGDVIANLVYDRNVKFNFLVHPGEGFDLGNTGRFSLQGAETIKRLIRNWGGNVIEWDPASGKPMPVEVDFVVLGKEPVVPKIDNPNAEEQYTIEKKKKEAENYESVRAQADGLHIPVMNQNRYLYFIGYFSAARRLAQ
jgi:hypothetical protein